MPARLLALVAEVEDLGDREVDVLAAGPVDGMPQVDQPLAVPVGQGLEQHAANDAEDGGVRADPEAEGQHHGEGEPASAGEAADGVAEVAK